MARVLRGAVACALLVMATGVAPVATLCLQDLHGCGSVCARCWCKKRPVSKGMRAPCPCCQPDATPADPTVHLRAAVLPDSTASVSIAPDRDAVAMAWQHAPSITRSVPHPPPRTLPQAIS